jgi:hypothetical protein
MERVAIELTLSIAKQAATQQLKTDRLQPTVKIEKCQEIEAVRTLRAVDNAWPWQVGYFVVSFAI